MSCGNKQPAKRHQNPQMERAPDVEILTLDMISVILTIIITIIIIIITNIIIIIIIIFIIIIAIIIYDNNTLCSDHHRQPVWPSAATAAK